MKAGDGGHDQAEVHGEDHVHAPGAHGGTIVPLGRDSYHVEPIFEKDGRISLYTLGADETRVVEVESQLLQAFVRPLSGSEAQPMELKADPQAGDPEGKTTRFTGTLPDALKGQPVSVTVPRFSIGGELFRLEFSTPEPQAGHAMPEAISSEEEKALYLTPGGLYTAADIEANGNQTASRKFRGFMAKHDMNPQTGDRICPITHTKGNPECTWVVNGQKYEFCCPPCVDEFVKLAKSDPDRIQAPDSYIKK